MERDRILGRHSASGTLREDHARLFFERSSLPQAFTDLDGALIAVNAAMTHLLGRTEEWLLGRDVVEVLHPLDEPAVSGRIAALRAGAVDMVTTEVVAFHAEGHTVQLLVDVALIREPTGSPQFVALLAHELTAVRTVSERLAGQERLYQELSNRAADAAVVTDADLLVTFVSPAVTDMLGHEQVDVLSTDLIDLVHPDERQEVRATVAEVVAHVDSSGRRLVRTRTAAGEWRWTELTIFNALANPDVGGLILNLRDVTAELEAERSVRESEARYRAIVETAQEGIVAIDAAGQVGLANDRITEILGLTMEEVRASTRVHDLVRAVSPGAAATGVVRQEVRYQPPAGGERVLSVSLTPLPGAGHDDGTLVMVSDVTEAHMMQERLRHQALHDQLTGLPNRYLFADRLEMAAARQERHPDGSTAVMYLDLDRFKGVNDTYGHAVGDRVLAGIADRLVGSVRTSDTVARLGGDEFAIVCEGLDEESARAVATRTRAEVFGSLEWEGHPLAVDASIGIAMFPPHDPAEALNLADTAMYQAKRLGGGGVIVFGVDT
ncbi:sensor domain-containing protein [Nocardioides gansuensis]|nr:sensor domain-containing diguanylate cyclase [Nocardioides gansuensis]